MFVSCLQTQHFKVEGSKIGGYMHWWVGVFLLLKDCQKCCMCICCKWRFKHYKRSVGNQTQMTFKSQIANHYNIRGLIPKSRFFHLCWSSQFIDVGGNHEPSASKLKFFTHQDLNPEWDSNLDSEGRGAVIHPWAHAIDHLATDAGIQNIHTIWEYCFGSNSWPLNC